MPQIDPVDRLRRIVEAHGTQGRAAKALGVSVSYLNDMLQGRRNISDAMLSRLSLRRIETIIEAK